MAARADRFTRIVILAWAVIGAALLVGVARGLLAIGFFTHLDPVHPVCRALPLAGAGDLALDAADKTLFIAAGNGLYALALDAPQAKPLRLPGTPPAFHPVAISLGHDPGGMPVLLAVNRRAPEQFAVEGFAVQFTSGVPTLSGTASVQSRNLTHPGGIAALGAGRFYIADDPVRSETMAWLDRYALLPRAMLLYFNGMLFRPSVNGLSDPSGVALAPDGTRLFIASRNERRVIGFSLDPVTGNLMEQGTLSLPLRPERLSLDAGGDLWIAGAVRLATPAPSAVVRVHVDAKGAPSAYETVFADDGHVLNGASAAARLGNRIFIAAAADNKLLDCRLK